MKTLSKFLICLLAGAPLFGQNGLPQVSNFSYTEDLLNNQVTFTYDLDEPENEACEVRIFYQAPGTSTFKKEITAQCTGDIGSGILQGAGKSVLYTYEPNELISGSSAFKIVVDDGYEWSVEDVLDLIEKENLESNLEFVEGARHRNSNPNHLKQVQDSIQSLFEKEGWELQVQTWMNGAYQAKNYIGKIQGTTQDTVWYLMGGHYDSVAGSPGADDNGSATAALMEAIRVLGKFGFKKTIRLVAFDMEEDGLVGSTRYVSNIFPEGERLDGFLDWEMIGYYRDDPNSQTVPVGFSLLFPGAYGQLEADSFKGNFITNVANANSLALQNAFNSAAASWVPELKIISVPVPGNGTIAPDLMRSDHAPFWIKGEPALMLTDGANFRNPNYHEATDVIDSIDFDFMEDVFKASIATICELAELHHAGTDTLSYDRAVSVNFLEEKAISIYPNPTQNSLNIKAGDLKIDQIDLYNMEGKLVKSITYAGNTLSRLDVGNLKKGFYSIKIKTDKGYWNSSFVKE
ncbi:MAG: M28 family peptidase [Saprospiraceae bacterium]